MPEIALDAGKVVLMDGKVSCTCCCPTTLPDWQADSVGKSFSKCGGSKPGEDINVRYRHIEVCDSGRLRTKIWDGDCVLTDTLSCVSGCGSFFEDDGGGKWLTRATTVSFTASICAGGTLTYTTTETEDIVLGTIGSGCSQFTYSFSGSSSSDCPGSFTCTSSRDSDGVWTKHVVLEGGFAYDEEGSCGDGYDGPATTEIEYSNPHTPFEPVYSDLYATSELIAKVQDAIAAEGFDSDYDDTRGSFRNLSSSELSYSERRSKERLPLAGLGLVDGKTYNAIYVVRFTPLGGGAGVDGSEQTLAVAFTTGMTHSAPVDVPVPTANGTSIPVLLRWECPEDEA